ncbi:hypothetical protein LCGC14_1518580 [marine sediment metagenome]|uniref:DUF1064 domain-containing protein n=1 Tax=marine sediment metagenome TaxID=412755 RepID=A0A0F9M0D4_9ZZZZ
MNGKKKYRNTPTYYNGLRFDSKAEGARAQELDMQKHVGAILFWLPQVTFRLGCAENKYRVDFLVVTKEGVRAEDVKGMETAKFKRDKKLWKAYGPCDLWIVRRQAKGWKMDIVEPSNTGQA